MVMVIEAQEDHSKLIPRLQGFDTAKPGLQPFGHAKMRLRMKAQLLDWSSPLYLGLRKLPPLTYLTLYLGASLFS
jgi:hypothetical protein